MKTSLLTLCLAPAALAAFVQISVPIDLKQNCEIGNGYCGSYLKNTLGYNNLPNYNDNALYYCDNVEHPDYIKKCELSCQGPKAHCGN